MRATLAFWTPAFLFGALLLLVSVSGFGSTDQAIRPGLLFHLSGEKGPTADFAANGRPEPTYCDEVSSIPDGAKGGALQCGHLQRLAYVAAGSIYAQRGTLSLFWRSREPVGPTEFPVFRVGFGDHSSWDMVWLRLDYNGHGFDAFVTDSSLARIRVSHRIERFPGPKEWTHLALTWDETKGIRLYVNGSLAERNDTPANLDTALDQFGPHSRIISPHQVQSDYNFVRGGDIDEVRIYDSALDLDAVAALARGDEPSLVKSPVRTLDAAAWRREWWWRYGWFEGGTCPPWVSGSYASVRKVEIHDAYDLKRWWWKANDGIRETTWPGVYNRSRIPGRNDYFQLPDWDCYSLSGQAISFRLPEEPWNQLEISGAASGILSLAAGPGDKAPAAILGRRPAGLERSTLRSAETRRGGVLGFKNDVQETPIGELGVYFVAQVPEPAQGRRISYAVSAKDEAFSREPVASLVRYLEGRYPADERTIIPLNLEGSSSGAKANPSPAPAALPLVHLVLPVSLDGSKEALDGISLELPAFDLEPTHGELLPFNLQIKDPAWPMRMLCDVSFSVKKGQAVKLWIDLRDRILPDESAVCLSLACAAQGLSPERLAGLKLSVVLKPAAEARAEHELDRFTQIRDAYAMLVEERPSSPKLALGVRFRSDLADLLKLNPTHDLARRYEFAAGLSKGKPDLKIAPVPEGVPGWAFRQVQLLDYARRFVMYYVEQRQLENGEIGGGLSDDTDLVNFWPGLALMGVEPERITDSLHRVLDACYQNGMFTNGVSTLQTDELHSYEEGINSIAQIMLLEAGSPLQVERAMETARAMERVTGINAAGHRHFRSSYYSGTKLATDSVWGWSKAYNHLVLHPGMNLVDYNGNPRARQLLEQIADGLLAHRHLAKNGRMTIASAVHFETDEEGSSTRPFQPFALFWRNYRWSGNAKYLDPILDAVPFSLVNLNANLLDQAGLRAKWATLHRSPENAGLAGEGRRNDARNMQGASQHFKWQVEGDKQVLERLYLTQIETSDALEYINTEGSLWTDRVGVPMTDLQRARLGGVALARNQIDTGHAVSWRFLPPAKATSVAILIPDAMPGSMNILVHNLEASEIRAQLLGWGIDPGLWELTQGIDTDGDDRADKNQVSRETRWERGLGIDLVFAPRATTHLRLRLKSPGIPYWQRPDLAVESRDLRWNKGSLDVTVHSLGSVPSSAATLVCRAAGGRELVRMAVSVIAAPLDLLPQTQTLSFGASVSPKDASGGSIEILPAPGVEEITLLNNRARIP